MDMVIAAMRPFYEQLAKRDDHNRREMQKLFDRTSPVRQDDRDTDIVFGRVNNETL